MCVYFYIWGYWDTIVVVKKEGIAEGQVEGKGDFWKQDDQRMVNKQPYIYILNRQWQNS